MVSLRQIHPLMKSAAKWLPTLLVLGILGAGWLAVHQINTGGQDESSDRGPEEAAATDAGVVTLPDGKAKAAGLRTQTVSPQQVEPKRVLSGRLRYDEAKHIDLMSPVEGILTDLLVKPGDQVEPGHVVAVISSPEIGRARSEVMKWEADLALEQRKFERAHQLSDNLHALFTELDAGTDIEDIETQFDDAVLGSYRERLLSAYSRWHLAKLNSESVKPLASSGSIAGRTIRERESERQVASSDYHSVRELAAFEAQQALLQAKATLAETERQLKIARQQRDSLLGYRETASVVDDADALSRIEIRAPFAGTIETRTFAQSERVHRGDSLFILADTTTLYVDADIRENDWPAIHLTTGQTVSVTIPAVEGRTFSAQVLYVGRQVMPDRNSVPLIATIDNSDGTLRPGMFVRVAVPAGEPREAMAVKPVSILRHDDKAFVFVALNEHDFQKTDVTTGIDTGDWVEITSGLRAGQQVVADGAFLLKSELLLEGEE